jgi:hypothetical protein
MADRFTILYPEERDDWLAARRPYFNASATAVLFDRHPYLSPGEYAAIKLSGVEQTPTRQMERGLRLEDAVAQWWADDNGYVIHPPVLMYGIGALLYSPDRETDGDELVEIKTANGYHNEPELYWLDQCQAAMLAAGRDRIHLVWMDARLDYGYMIVEADEAWQAEILRGAEWWMSFIRLGMEPEGVRLTYRQESLVHPVASVAKAELDGEGFQWVQALRVARDHRIAAVADEDRIRGEVAHRLGDAEEGWWEGAPVVTWRNDRPGMRFDTKAHRQARPDCDALFSVPKVGTRRMLLVGGRDTEGDTDE